MIKEVGHCASLYFSRSLTNLSFPIWAGGLLAFRNLTFAHYASILCCIVAMQVLFCALIQHPKSVLMLEATDSEMSTSSVPRCVCM